MKIAVTGASGVLGRGLVGRLLSLGHEVVGLARHRPDSWPSAAHFVAGDIRDAAAVRQALGGADVVAHLAWSVADEVNVGGTANVLDAIAQTGPGRIVFGSSAHAVNPVSAQARAEALLAASGAQWVAIRSAIVLSRNVNNRVLRLLARPALPGPADRRLQVIHSDDAVRLLMHAVVAVEADIDSGPVNLAAHGDLSIRQLAAAVGRPVLPRWATAGFGDLRRLLDAPLMDTSRLRDDWGFTPAWTAAECADDFALAVRGRVSFGRRLVALPWQLTNIQDIPAPDAPAVDGTKPVPAGPEGGNGEFDTPIDPRFPTFLATNLSEALPGPFSPSSASVAVRGLRAGGVGIAERLRPGGLIQREIATRTVGVFAHRLYGAITTAHFTAEVVPFVKPATVVSSSQFFGPSLASLPIFGEQRLPRESRGAARLLRTIRNIGVFGVNLVGLSAGSHRDTGDYIANIERLEGLTGGDIAELDDARLLSLILLARDEVVHGWVLASGSFMLSAAFSLILRILGGQHVLPPVGPELVSARPLGAVHRLVLAAQRDPAVTRLLAEPGDHLDALATQAPKFHAAVLAELALIGHRGPAEVEMLSTTYADDPELLIRMVAKSLHVPAAPAPQHPPIPLPARPVALLSARTLRDREVRRDRMVRAIWVLRKLLREYGRRLVQAGIVDAADDVFYLLVDELDALPAHTREVVARRRAERHKLQEVIPPAVFSGSWQAATNLATVLTAGETLEGLGVCGGQVRGRVRIVRPETIEELDPGEILVAEVTDVGYTIAFSYAAAVVTELGGPMSHAAVVAREFGVPCVVDVHGATHRLPEGALIEVDGRSGQIRVLELADSVSATGHDQS